MSPFIQLTSSFTIRFLDSISIPFAGPKMWKLWVKIVKSSEKAKGCRVLVILSLSLKEVQFYGDKYTKDNRVFV